MAKIVKNNLGYLGVDFQYKLIAAFIERPKFFKDLYPIIDQNMFTESYLKTIVGVMKDYYKKYDITASYDIILIKLRDRSFTKEDIDYYTETIEKLRNLTTEGIDEVEEMAEKFFKQQNWIRIANEIRRVAGDGDMSKYDECEQMIREANSIGRKTLDIASPVDSINEDLSKENIISIPTGIPKIDECLGGGLDKGKLGLIMAAMGSGKTSITTAFSAAAATYKCKQNNYKGYKILHIVFEDTRRDINRKYFGRLTQIETKDLNKDAETTDRARELLKNHPDFDFIKENIRVVRLDTGRYTASDIVREAKKIINEGFKPDGIITDYFECVLAERGTGNLKKWEQETVTMRVFENGAKELNVAWWLPSQGNRESVSSNLITMDQGSGSIGKQQVAQVVMSITRSVDDINNQRATLAILKNRSGSAGIVLQNLKFNNGTCTITCDDVIDFDNPLKFNEYNENQSMAKRYDNYV